MGLPPLNQLSMRGRKLVSTGVNLIDVNSGLCTICLGPMHSHLPHPVMTDQPLLDPRVLLMDDEDIMIWCGDTAVLPDHNRYHRRCLCDFYHAWELEIDRDRANMAATGQEPKFSHLWNDYNPSRNDDVQLSDADVRDIKEDIEDGSFGQVMNDGAVKYALQEPITADLLTEMELERFTVAKAAKTAHEANERRLLQEKTDAEEAHNAALAVINAEMQNMMEQRSNDQRHHDNLMGGQIALQRQIEQLQAEVAPLRAQKKAAAARVAAARAAAAAAQKKVEEEEAAARAAAEEAEDADMKAKLRAARNAKKREKKRERQAEGQKPEPNGEPEPQEPNGEPEPQQEQERQTGGTSSSSKFKTPPPGCQDVAWLHEGSRPCAPVKSEEEYRALVSLKELLFVPVDVENDKVKNATPTNSLKLGYNSLASAPLSDTAKYRPLIVAEFWWQQVLLGVHPNDKVACDRIGKLALEENGLVELKNRYKRDLEVLIGGPITPAVDYVPESWEVHSLSTNKEPPLDKSKPDERREKPFETIPYLRAPPLCHLAMLYQGHHVFVDQFLKKKTGREHLERKKRMSTYKITHSHECNSYGEDVRTMHDNLAKLMSTDPEKDHGPYYAQQLPISTLDVQTTFHIIAAKMLLGHMEELIEKLREAYGEGGTGVRTMEAVTVAEDPLLEEWIEFTTDELVINPESSRTQAQTELIANITSKVYASECVVDENPPPVRGEYRLFEGEWYAVLPHSSPLNYSLSMIRSFLGEVFKMSLHAVTVPQKPFGPDAILSWTTSMALDHRDNRPKEVRARGFHNLEPGGRFVLARLACVEDTEEFASSGCSATVFPYVIRRWLSLVALEAPASVFELRLSTSDDALRADMLTDARDAGTRFVFPDFFGDTNVNTFDAEKQYDAKLFLEEQGVRKREDTCLREDLLRFDARNWDKFGFQCDNLHKALPRGDKDRPIKMTYVGMAVRELYRLTVEFWEKRLGDAPVKCGLVGQTPMTFANQHAHVSEICNGEYNDRFLLGNLLALERVGGKAPVDTWHMFEDWRRLQMEARWGRLKMRNTDTGEVFIHEHVPLTAPLPFQVADLVESVVKIPASYNRRSMMRSINYFCRWQAMTEHELDFFTTYGMTEKERIFYLNDVTKTRGENPYRSLRAESNVLEKPAEAKMQSAQQELIDEEAATLETQQGNAKTTKQKNKKK